MGKTRLPTLFITPILCCGFIVSNLISPAIAAEDAISDASIVSYEQAYFVKFAPVTLLDMLQRIPGVPDILNKNRRQRNNQRGFGSGGDQILIDGRRLAGKSNNINDALARISAEQILKIDLIRGATSGLDVQSQGLVINILLKEGGAKSTTFWRIFGEYTSGYDLLPQFLVSHSGSTGNLEYSVAAERKNDNGYRPRDEIFYDGNDVQTGTQVVDHAFNFKGIKLTSNLTYSFESGDELRLNGLFEPNKFKFHETRIEMGNEADNVIWDRNSDNEKWEIGGDYTFTLGSIGKFKSLFVINQNIEDTEITRVRDFEMPSFMYENEFTDTRRSEKILRSSTTITIFGDQSIEIGGEGAINKFSKTFQNYDRSIEADPLELGTNDNVKIKENRYEIFAIHNYNISPSMVVQSSLTTEFSKIVADNILLDGSINRRDTAFTYFKPRIDFRYDYTKNDQFRATVEKKVSQLRFDTFVTSYDAQNDELKVGNTELLPTQTWEFSLAYEHRLPNDAGSIEGSTYYHYRKDHQTRVDFTDYVDFGGNPIGIEEFFALPPSDALRDEISFTPTQGNITSAYIYGIDLKSNLRMGFIGVPEAVLSLGYRYEKRRSLDQFTQLMRNFANYSDHVYNVDFRHDITKWRFSYGFGIKIRSDWAKYDMKYYNPLSPSAFIKAFAEYNLKNGVKVRFDMLEISGSGGHATTIRYTDHIRFNEIYKREERENGKPRVYQFTVQGSF